VSGWQPDGAGITASGDSKADDQVGDSCSVRFRHPGLPGAVVTCTSYARTGYCAPPGEFYVQTSVERLTCADPDRLAETATWHDIEFEDEDGTWGAAADAEAAAWQTAAKWIEAAETIDWDGQPY
jgi:hypothetical protein